MTSCIYILLSCRPENLHKYLHDIVKHRWSPDFCRGDPLEDTPFSELPLRTKVEILYALCDYRLDAVDVFDAVKVSIRAYTWYMISGY